MESIRCRDSQRLTSAFSWGVGEKEGKRELTSWAPTWNRCFAGPANCTMYGHYSLLGVAETLLTSSIRMLKVMSPCFKTKLANVRPEIRCWVWHQRLFSWHMITVGITHWCGWRIHRGYMIAIVLVNTVTLAQNYFRSCFFLCVFFFAHMWAHMCIRICRPKNGMGCYPQLCSTVGLEPGDLLVAVSLSSAEGTCALLSCGCQRPTQVLMLAWHSPQPSICLLVF